MTLIFNSAYNRTLYQLVQKPRHIIYPASHELSGHVTSIIPVLTRHLAVEARSRIRDRSSLPIRDGVDLPDLPLSPFAPLFSI